jgi:peptide/nickel transport system permease protein
MKRIGKRLVTAVATLWAVSALMFASLMLLPGDAAEVALGQQATPERIAALREQYGLDEPAWRQYWDWLSGVVVHRDFGTSLQTGEPVWNAISVNVQHSVVLASLAISIMVPFALLLGVVSAVWRDRAVDHVVSSTALGWAATPEFAVGSVLIIVFTNALGWFPATSLLAPGVPVLEQFSSIALPLMTLVLVSVAQSARMIRASMINALSSDYVRAAELRGIPRRAVVLRHALPNAADSIIAIVVLTIGWLIGGVVVTETLFQFPGVGVATTTAVNGRDIPTVLACCMLITAVLIVGNLLADVISTMLDPRLRARRT